MASKFSFAVEESYSLSSARSRLLYMEQEDLGPTQPTRTSKRSPHNGRDKGHKQLKQLSETWLTRSFLFLAYEVWCLCWLLKVSEPKDFDQVLRSFSDKSSSDLSEKLLRT